MSQKSVSLLLLAFCALCAMTLWFSATAVIPSLKLEYGVSDTRASLFTSMVQVGFVTGTLISAIFGLADRLDPRRFFMTSAIVATVANAGILLVEPSSPIVLLCRFITGACIAGVYPVGMKMATTWAKGDMGLLVGGLVAALAFGSASPHLLNAFGGIDWRFTVAGASLIAIVGAFAINLVTLGPNVTPNRAFQPRLALKAWTSPGLRLANLGYLGHMWELYAMWAWLGVFLDASFRLTIVGPDAVYWARMATFVAMGLGGAVGCVAGGYLADRIGRTALTMGAMTISGACALVVGLLFEAHPIVLFAICLIWGITVIADSAQFSASTAELSDGDLVGTMLTVQTCAGFLLTLATIHLMPPLVDLLGWRYAFAVLAVGPLFGVIAMGRLRAHPEGRRLAGGNR